MKGAFYTVVENAGYVGEWDAKAGFKNVVEAWDWIYAHYDANERERLHIDVRRDPEGTYDF